MCYDLAEARGNTFEANIDKMVILNLGTDIKSINIVQEWQDKTDLFGIPSLVKSPG